VRTPRTIVSLSSVATAPPRSSTATTLHQRRIYGRLVYHAVWRVHHDPLRHTERLCNSTATGLDDAIGRDRLHRIAYIDDVLYIGNAAFAAATFLGSRMYTGARTVTESEVATMVHMFRVVRVYDAFQDVALFVFH